jgi:hypothetical protein
MFVRHPSSIGMTYWTHQKRAWSMAYDTGKATLALLIHGAFPFWHTDTGGRIITRCYKNLHSCSDACVGDKTKA